MTRRSLKTVAAGAWLVWVTVAIVGLAGFAVYRLQGAFGSENQATPGGMADQIVPFNPKRVQIEVFGDPGATATITYTDVEARPQRADGVALPWTYDGTTTIPAVLANVQAQGDGYSRSCRITIDGVVKVENSSQGAGAFVYCLDKSG